MDSKEEIIKQIKSGYDFLCKAVRINSIKAIEAYKIIESRLINTAVSCQIKATVAYQVIKPIVIESIVRFAKFVVAKTKYISQQFETKFGKVHFDFHHFVMTTGSAVLVFALTFTLTGMNRSQVSASEIEPVPVKDVVYNKEAIEINFGDDTPIKNVIHELLADKTGNVNEARPITLHGGNVGYEYGDYIVSFDKVQTRELKEDQLTISVQTKETYNTEDFKKIVVPGGTDTNDLLAGTVSAYKLNVKYVDVEAPSVVLSESRVEMDDVDPLYVKQYVQTIVDNYDGEIANFEIEHAIPEKDEERWEPGEYTVTYKATDSNGNVGTASLQMVIHETQDEEEVVGYTAAGEPVRAASTAASYEGAGSVYGAALGQLGNYQDCTMLVTNALRSVGIYHHGWPASYLSLGTVVSASEAQPGDVIYYANGGTGWAHVAIYAGNGQAVHGGWLGNQTVVNTAYVGSGPVFIRISK